MERRSAFRCWVEAMRLRTLPVSVAGVAAGTALALLHHGFRAAPAVICLLFAVLAQIASNFANEYFDYRDGLDRRGRQGPRRGVTEGDITPSAMKYAALGTLGVAALLGLTLLMWGGWWIVIAGVAIVLGALAYSAGPYPLSRHGMGEVAVILFFGVAPVTLTYYLQAGDCPSGVWLASLGVGLLGANVLIVNNYRDREDDAAVGKRTLAVIFGGTAVRWLYLINGLAGASLVGLEWKALPGWEICNFIMTAVVIALWLALGRLKGRALTPILGMTAVSMGLYCLIFLICCAVA